MNNVEHQIIRSQVSDMNDEKLIRELTFAEAFNKGGSSASMEPNAEVWLAALREEKAKRDGR